MSAPNPSVFDSLAADARSEDPLDARLLAEIGARLADYAGGNPLAALLADFRAQGFEREVGTWLAPGLSGSPAPLPSGAVEKVGAHSQVINEAWLADLSKRNRVDRATVSRRLANLLPRAIKTLTPRGEVPSERALAIGLDVLQRRASR
jgi:uncharacterized protein YidB (DUF937 family)